MLLLFYYRTTVYHLIRAYTSIYNFMLSSGEHKKRFITSGSSLKITGVNKFKNFNHLLKIASDYFFHLLEVLAN